jgi:RNA-directed DNA polymerase
VGGGKAGHFDQLCSLEHLFASWDRFAHGKRNKADVQKYARNLEENIFGLQDDLATNRYRHGTYEPFIVNDPKRRQIHKANVQDRIVHQAVFDIIEPFFEKRFIHDSFSCRKGKGTHAGVGRLRKFLGQASKNNTLPVYALKCDIKGFFASVDHGELLDLLSNFVTDEKVLNLLEEIINSFSVIEGKGIPLGNLTSQLFANVYMHEFDWFVKHGLRQKHYIRYCDDFVIVGTDRQHLVQLVDPIEKFLLNELKLRIHPDKIELRSWNQGIDFLGYILKPYCTLIRTKTQRRILERINGDNLTSYLGVCSHAQAYELKQFMLTKLS